METKIAEKIDKVKQKKDKLDTTDLMEEQKTVDTSPRAQKKEQTQLSKVWKEVRQEYKLKKIIGKGSFGQVVKGTHKQFGHTVAIKLIEDVNKNQYILKQVIREISILRRLSEFKGNTHTVKLYDVVTNDDLDHVFIIMEYVQKDLKKVLGKADCVEMSQDHSNILIYKLLCAVNYLHSANIIHRDLKPGNILIDENCNLKICDFGLARTLYKIENPYKERTKDDIACKLGKLNDKRQKKKRELSNHVCSRWYRPPEIILLEKQYNSKVDIWGAGCIIAEIIQSTNNYMEQGMQPSHRFLFPGDSSYPLSPINDDDEFVSELDQLQVILRTLGKQEEKDMSFISLDSAVTYANAAQIDLKKIKFDQEYPYTNKELTDILHSMLEFNPYFRKPASQLLKLDIFKNHHEMDPKLSMNAPETIQLDIDKKGAFDYEESEMKNISTQDLKSLLINEIGIIRSPEYQQIVFADQD